MSMAESSHNNSIETSVDPPSQPVAAADDAATNADNNDGAAPVEEAVLRATEICNQLMAVVLRREEFPARQRETIVDLAEEFLAQLGDDIHDMVTDQTYGPAYNGLNSDRDSVAEITTALDFYPDTLTRRKDTDWNHLQNEWVDVTDEEAGDYPIMCLALLIDPDSVEAAGGKHVCNTQAVAFIDLFARLAIENGSFDDAERGGLLITSNTDDGSMSDCVLKQLVYHSYPSYGDEHNRLVDARFLKELMELRRLGLFIKEDIERFELLHTVVSFRRLDAHRARFILNGDPAQLVQVNDQDFTPLGCAAFESVAAFQWTFQNGLRYYPRMAGIHLLFQKNVYLSGDTPFQTACRIFGKEETRRVIEETLAQQYPQRIPLNIMEALIAAAINNRIHLDCVYFLLRRHPEMITAQNTNTNSIRAHSSLRRDEDEDMIQKKCGGTDTPPDNGGEGEEGMEVEAGRHHHQAGEAFCRPDPHNGGGGGNDPDQEFAITSTNKRKREG